MPVGHMAQDTISAARGCVQGALAASNRALYTHLLVEEHLAIKQTKQQKTMCVRAAKRLRNATVACRQGPTFKKMVLGIGRVASWSWNLQ